MVCGGQASFCLSNCRCTESSHLLKIVLILAEDFCTSMKLVCAPAVKPKAKKLTQIQA